MKTIQKILVAIIFWWPLVLLAQTSIYVSPSGNDSNGGSAAKPFASINRAVAEARKLSGEVKINLLEGTYYLSQPVVFTAEDSRKEIETLTIKKFNNQKVSISGSVVLKLKWSPSKNGIWQAKVTQDFIFDQLFVDGQLQRMARYPNY